MSTMRMAIMVSIESFAAGGLLLTSEVDYLMYAGMSPISCILIVRTNRGPRY